MKQHIKIEDLKKNTRFSKDLFFEDGHCLLLSAGNPLGDRELRVLRQWKIPFVVTDGVILSDDEEIDLEALESFEEDEKEQKCENSNNVYIEGSQLSQENIEAVSKMVVFELPKELKMSDLYSEYKKLVNELNDTFNAIKENKKLEKRAFSPYAQTIQKMAYEHPKEIVMFILAENTQDFAVEALNVALTVALICPLMNLNKDATFDIVIASLLHNVGVLRLPTSLTNKADNLTEAEIQILKTHILHAYKCAVDELSYSESVGNSILQQYERWDGKGYPEGLSGTNIDLGSRLISISDAFVLSLAKKVDGKSPMSYEVVKSLLSYSSSKFDPNIVKMVIQCVGIYPIGSVVLLNDGAICKVVQIATDAPLRPCVQVILSETGKIYTQEDSKIIDLKEYKDKFIVRAMDPRIYLK